MKVCQELGSGISLGCVGFANGPSYLISPNFLGFAKGFGSW